MLGESGNRVYFDILNRHPCHLSWEVDATLCPLLMLIQALSLYPSMDILIDCVKRNVVSTFVKIILIEKQKTRKKSSDKQRLSVPYN